MSVATVKLVADVEPWLKSAVDKKARQLGITKRAAVELALNDWVAHKMLGATDYPLGPIKEAK